MNNEFKIITLGDIFKNIETEEKAFKFKDYIKDIQQENERLHSIIKEVREYIEKELDIEKICRQEKSLTICKKELLEILDKENK